MKTSSNYGLKLMEGTDNVKRQDFVDNFTKIDTEMRVIENGGYPIVEATGTNSYTGSTARIKTLTKGTKLTLFVGADATGNCSLNLNGYGAKSIKDSNKNIVKNLKANVPYNLCYNGSDFILQGKGGGGNLIPKYLLAGYYGEGDNGRVDGAMVNRGAPTANLNCGGTYNLQEGYYSGGKVTANSLASQTSANATAAQIPSGYSAWVNGEKINGGMPNRGEYQMAGGIGSGDDYIALNKIPYGYYPQSSNGWAPEIRAKKADVANAIGLTADKIVKGNNILGIDGAGSNIMQYKYPDPYVTKHFSSSDIIDISVKRTYQLLNNRYNDSYPSPRYIDLPYVTFDVNKSKRILYISLLCYIDHTSGVDTSYACKMIFDGYYAIVVNTYTNKFYVLENVSNYPIVDRSGSDLDRLYLPLPITSVPSGYDVTSLFLGNIFYEDRT